MRTDNKRKSKFLPQSLGLTVLGLVVIFAVVTFAVLLAGLGMLPGKYTAIILAVLLIVTVVIIKFLCCHKDKTKQRKVGVVLSVFMILVMGVGCFYMASTYAALGNMSDEDKQYEDFYVVVIKGSQYHDVKDIEGKNVHTYNSTSATYIEARGMLQDEASVTYTVQDSFMNLQEVLIDKEGKKHDEIIFLSSSNYAMLCEDFDEFERETKVIHTVSVELIGSDNSKRIDVTKQPFNVYISGIDTFGSINKVARSDVNMIMTVNPISKEILLTSIPRDSYVTLHSYGALDKLTHSGIYGVNETVSTVEDWLGMDINYYIRVNFTSLKDVVDAIGGIEVESEYAFDSAVSDYSYVKGVNQLDGKAALFFARERKAFADGDQQRIKNQQLVLKGILEKITGSPAILTGYTQIMSSVGDEVQTSLTQKDMAALVQMQLADLGDWTITMQSIEGAGAYATTYSMGNRELYVVMPDPASVQHAQDEIQRVMNGL